MLLALLIGDYCGDGHGKHEKYIYESNLDSTAIEEAYTRGSTLIGFDLVKEVAREHDNRNLTPEQREIILRLGVDLEYTEEDLGWDTPYIMDEEWPEVYLAICKLGNPNLIIEKAHVDYVDTGGYGLFY